MNIVILINIICAVPIFHSTGLSIWRHLFLVHYICSTDFVVLFYRTPLFHNFFFLFFLGSGVLVCYAHLCVHCARNIVNSSDWEQKIYICIHIVVGAAVAGVFVLLHHVVIIVLCVYVCCEKCEQITKAIYQYCSYVYVFVVHPHLPAPSTFEWKKKWKKFINFHHLYLI